MKQHIVRIGLGLLVLMLFLVHAAEFFNIRIISQLDAIIYDARVRLTMPGKLDDRIVIVDIDEKSLGKLGRWPWSRDKMAELIDKLFTKYGVVMVGFDVVFAEPDVSSGIRTLEGLTREGALKDNEQFRTEIEKLKPALDYDARFAKAMSGKPVVLGYYLSSEEDAEKSGVLPPAVMPGGTFKGRDRKSVV